MVSLENHNVLFVHHKVTSSPYVYLKLCEASRTGSTWFSLGQLASARQELCSNRHWQVTLSPGQQPCWGKRSLAALVPNYSRGFVVGCSKAFVLHPLLAGLLFIGDLHQKECQTVGTGSNVCGITLNKEVRQVQGINTEQWKPLCVCMCVCVRVCMCAVLLKRCACSFVNTVISILLWLWMWVTPTASCW